MSDASGVLRIPPISSQLVDLMGRRERCPDSEWPKLIAAFEKRGVPLPLILGPRQAGQRRARQLEVVYLLGPRRRLKWVRIPASQPSSKPGSHTYGSVSLSVVSVPTMCSASALERLSRSLSCSLASHPVRRSEEPRVAPAA
jgi:hypothetical protein